MMSTQKLHKQPGRDESTHLHRIGSVSRLAGVPVSTLRMWESRYGAFTPGKSSGRHRLYAHEDVVRAKLLRELAESGHSIGRIAHLPMETLQLMLTDARAAAPDAEGVQGPARLSMAIVNAELATRLQAPGWAGRLGGALPDVRAVFMSLEEACDPDSLAVLRGTGMLLARVNALQPSAIRQLVHLKTVSGAAHAVLLYNFGPQAGIEALRDAGFLLRREPIDDGELAELLRAATWAPRRPVRAEPAGGAALPRRRYSEADLARIAASPSGMLCECPRHLADIITQLASFEEYSAQCLNNSDEDAQVHAQLRSIAGSARALFEGAMDLVIAHDGKSGGRGG